ncbi:MULTISPECIES: VOC family protein [unclassified Duganella]|uniref:VOC family protein n=1 Tax=unclassified Duganella TaxID=2636909 RepID=UPI000E351790|nr:MULTISPECIES: VOC family protein [unclassified Duganella]RFP09941.1 VOC family protein [Duganella sp. BJB475]RFP25756.1 VOC family protein [Duganella sp. BJB476]
MQLNHLHLSVTDVAAASAFFTAHFNFTLSESRGNNGMAIIRGEAGMLLILMRHASKVDPEHAYPPMFHVGFLVADEAAVDRKHAELSTGGFDIGDIELTRGARRFYCRAPGGITVEVGHEAA